MNLFRGAGIRGLTGIHPVRGRVIHPLLFASRSEIESWAEEHDLHFREDQTNKDCTYRRNSIRWDILAPLNRHYGQAIVTAINRAGVAAREVDELIQISVEKAVEQEALVYKNHEFILDIPKFLGYFTAIQKGLLMHVIRLLRPKTPFVNYHEIEQCLTWIDSQRSSRMDLGNSVEVIRASDRLYFRKKQPKASVYRTIPWNQWTAIPEMGGRIRISWLGQPDKDVIFKNDPFFEYIDGNCCSGQTFLIRSWRQGDHFSPLGMKGQKKVQDLFVDLKIPRHRRSRIPILEVNGEIVWVVGLRISNQVRVKPTTNQIVQLQWAVDPS